MEKNWQGDHRGLLLVEVSPPLTGNMALIDRPKHAPSRKHFVSAGRHRGTRLMILRSVGEHGRLCVTVLTIWSEGA